MDDSSVGKKFPLDNLFAAFRATNAQKSYPEKGAGCGRNLDSSPIEQTIGWQRVLKGRYPQFKARETVIQLLSLVVYLVGEAHISGGHITTTQYLRIFLTKFARDFRPHGGVVYHYEAGCWAKRDSPAVASQSLESFPTAADGPFSHLAKENAQ